MAKSKATQSPYYAAYRRERRRIQQTIRRAKAEGFIFETEHLPARPKTITEASVRRLQAITRERIYTGRGTSYITPEGVRVSGRAGYQRRLEDKRIRGKLKIGELVIQNILNYINEEADKTGQQSRTERLVRVLADRANALMASGVSANIAWETLGVQLEQYLESAIIPAIHEFFEPSGTTEEERYNKSEQAFREYANVINTVAGSPMSLEELKQYEPVEEWIV